MHGTGRSGAHAVHFTPQKRTSKRMGMRSMRGLRPHQSHASGHSLSLPILCDKCCGNSSCCCSSPPHLWRRTASKQMATEMNTEGLCLQRWDHSDKPVLRTALCRGSSDIAASLDVGSAASTDPGLQHCPQPCWGSSNLETGRRVSSALCRMTALQA